MAKRKIIEIDREKCNGCGLCTKACAEGALMLDEYKPHSPSKESKVNGTSPGNLLRKENRGQDKRETSGKKNSSAADPVPSELSQWPIQLHLISPIAPYFKACDLLIAADCTAFTLGSFHQDMLRGKKLVIACPKLDETGGYVEKIAELLKNNTVYSLTVVIMEVPCCSGLFRMVQEAVELSGTRLPVKKVVIWLDGAIRN